MKSQRWRLLRSMYTQVQRLLLMSTLAITLYVATTRLNALTTRSTTLVLLVSQPTKLSRFSHACAGCTLARLTSSATTILIDMRVKRPIGKTPVASRMASYFMTLWAGAPASRLRGTSVCIGRGIRNRVKVYYRLFCRSQGNSSPKITQCIFCIK